MYRWAVSRDASTLRPDSFFPWLNTLGVFIAAWGERFKNDHPCMPTIHLTTFIAAPIERVFDLSRSIELHKKSMAHHREQAVAGTTMGLINLNETVTWKAKHLMRTRVLQVQITSMERPFSFTDEMKKGDFKSMKHEHHFKAIENGTLMIDVFKYEAPYGGLGNFFSGLYLSAYLEKLLEQRNSVIKEYAESNKWKHVLDNKQ